jgi:hypothetical protein
MSKTNIAMQKYRFLSEDDSERMKSILGRGFYPIFEEKYRKMFGVKPKDVPSHQSVISYVNGRTRNIRITKVIREMMEENISMEKEIKTLLGHAEAAEK